MTEMRVHIVDDDADVLQSLSFMLGGEGFTCTTHLSGEAFLAALPELEEGCILLDLKMELASGLDVQLKLAELGRDLPVIMMTGHGSVDSAVAAMKLGAIDFIQKPFGKADLMVALEAAHEKLATPERDHQGRTEACRLMDALSPRERQVVDGLAHGQPNKNIAYELGISPRTVEIHRANAMRKLEVRTLPGLLHIAFQAGIMAK